MQKSTSRSNKQLKAADEPTDSVAADGIVSVERALSILEWLADEHDGLSFPELRRLLNINQGLCFKLLQTLEGAGYILRQEQTGRYFLTYKISNLSLRRLHQARLLDQCSGVLRALANSTGELARLAMVERDRITWVLSVAGEGAQNHSLRIDTYNTQSIGLHSHATGKAWLSTMSFERVRDLLRIHGIKPLTPHTLTSMNDIKAELERTRRAGFARSYEEHELGIAAVAAPIVIRQLDGSLTCVGTVSLAAPTSRMSREDLDLKGGLVARATHQLEASWPLSESTSPDNSLATSVPDNYRAPGRTANG
jgi:IclR family transcriptional regulator, acetate operon repressor